MARARGTKTHCPRGHERTPENTYYGKNGRNTCRVCSREHHREHVARQREATQLLGSPSAQRATIDTVQIAAFRAAHEAGVLDDLLMRRFAERMVAA